VVQEEMHLCGVGGKAPAPARPYHLGNHSLIASHHQRNEVAP
jgi:hypothetical protein